MGWKHLSIQRWEWIRNFTSHFIMDVSRLEFKLCMLVKGTLHNRCYAMKIKRVPLALWFTMLSLLYFHVSNDILFLQVGYYFILFSSIDVFLTLSIIAQRCLDKELTRTADAMFTNAFTQNWELFLWFQRLPLLVVPVKSITQHRKSPWPEDTKRHFADVHREKPLQFGHG